MRSLFDLSLTDWPQDHNALHVYALPDFDTTVLAPIQNAIRDTAVCSVQPTKFLHATVTRVPAFLDTTPTETLRELQAGLDETVAKVAPFTVELAGPHVSPDSVELGGQRSPEWDRLVESVRSCAAAVLGGVEMPPEPSAPHVSLGYGTREVASEPLIAELACLAAGREPQLVLPMRITDVQLLAVHQDAVAGIYTWDTISSHVFGGLPKSTILPHL
ncbi:2'-5' RNA ligase family protein [Prescottella agglutinans]|uniref:2'-5' RNA ligase family protein n=1 Tax=Prescottella agglutinans TaxID=1644129 RepID=UPI003D964660